MIRNWFFCALSCLCVTGLSTNAFADDKVGGDKGSASSREDNIEKLLLEIKGKLDRISVAEAKIELQASDIKELKRRLDETLARLEQIEKARGPAFSYVPPQNLPPLMGKLYLINSWDSSVTYFINGRPYVVPARQSMTVEQMPGLFSYDIIAEGFGVIDSRRDQDLRAGQNLTMQVYRR